MYILYHTQPFKLGVNRDRKEDKEKLDEAALEREFKTFIAKLKKQFGDNLAYQVSNYPEVSATDLIYFPLTIIP